MSTKPNKSEEKRKFLKRFRDFRDNNLPWIALVVIIIMLIGSAVINGVF